MKFEKMFVLVVGMFYIVIRFVKPEIFNISVNESLSLLKELILPFTAVVILLLVINTSKGKDMLRKCIRSRYSLLLMILVGIISMGAIYLFYPILKKLKEEGASYGHISAFIYARAIKFPLLPILIYYFGFVYATLFTLTLFIFSFLIFYFTNILMRWFDESSNSNK